MNTTDAKAFAVGRSLVAGLTDEFCAAQIKMGTVDEVCMMHAGAVATIAGIVRACIGRDAALITLNLAIETLKGMPDEPR